MDLLGLVKMGRVSLRRGFFAILLVASMGLMPWTAGATSYTATFTQISTSGTPGAAPFRAWSAMTWVDSLEWIVLWGGSGAKFLNDIQALDPLTTEWVTLDPDVECPGNTSFAKPNGSDESGVVWDSISDLLWIYNGGSGYRCPSAQYVGHTAGAGTTSTSIVDPALPAATEDYYRDWTVRVNGIRVYVNAYSAATKTLSLSAPLAVSPGAYYDLYADTGEGTWSYDFATGSYSKLALRHWGYSGIIPPYPRLSPGFASDGTKAILFGGHGYDDATYKLDFAARSYSIAIAAGSPASPPARGQILGHFVYDSGHHRFVLFGGRCFDPARCAQGPLDDTWLYDPIANTWTNVTAAIRPRARDQAQMYFDQANGVVVLYGGRSNGDVLNDLWTFDVGTLAWTQQAMPAVNPGGVYNGQVAYAPTTDCGNLVYGGNANGGYGIAWQLCLIPSGTTPPPAATSTVVTSSANPALAGTTVTLTATVTGANPTGSVGFTDNANPITGCTALPLTGSGNARTATCPATGLTVGAHGIVASYVGDAGNFASVSLALTQNIDPVPTGSINVALAANGGVASASSTLPGRAPGVLIDNERAGINFASAGYGGIWKDATYGAFPDWAQVNFNGSKTINRVVVYTAQTNYTAPVEPTDTLTTTLGLTDFTVQGWDGGAWVVLASVTGNNLVKRTLIFPAFATDRIRVNVTLAPNESRLAEVEAWTAAASTSYTVTPAAGTGGTVNPATAQTVSAGATTAFVVTANAGYTRDTAVGGTCAPGNWNGNTWTTGAISANCTVSFSFTAAPISYTVTPAAGAGGTVNPATAQTVSAGATTAFVVTANAGYTRDTAVGGTCAPGSWNGNTWTTGTINADCTVSFSFTAAPISYTVTPAAGTGGTVNPATAQTVSAGATTAFVVTANAGYTRDTAVGGTCAPGSWNGNTWTTGTISANCTVSFSFTAAPISYTVTPAAGTGGTVNPATAQTVSAGATTAFVVTANAGYTRDTAVGGTCAPGSWNGNTWTTGTINADCTVSFSFTAAPISYTVTPAAGTGGTVNPATAQTVSAGATTAFVVTANAGYTRDTAVGGTCAPGSWNGNTWTTGTISANCTVSFSFTAAPISYTVTPAAGTGGTVNPATAQTVSAGATTAFVVTANAGYTRDTAVGGTCAPGSWNGNTWTTGTINADCTVSFSFTAAPISYTVTPAAGTGGTVSPATVQTVSAGATTAFVVTANAGYTRDTAVGGTCAPGNWNGNTWTTGTISADCTVSFSFTINPTGSANVALAANGGVASASSTLPGRAPGVLIDNERAGINFASAGYGGIWKDATYGAFPDWAQVNFNGSKTINRVVVYTAQTNYTAPVEPTDTLTTTLGLTDFTVQGWDGGAWVVLASVTGNNLVKRTLIFPAFATDRIRVNVTLAPNESRLAEVEAWTAAASTSYTVTPAAGTGGTVNPATAQTVSAGATTAFVVTANAGYTRDTAVGGTCAPGNWNGNTWTTGAISANCTVSFSFTINPTTSVNVALAANGGVASASSTLPGRAPGVLIDNERAGINFASAGYGGIWKDATYGAFPDWAQVNFNGSKTINRVVVYTAQTNYTAPVEPTDTLTTTLGLTDFTVQGWDGGAWVVLASVTGNNLVKRTLIFPAFATDRIRVNVTLAPNESRLAEVEAWTAPAQAPTLTLQSVATGLAFPVDITHAGDGSGRLFVVEQDGRIRIVSGGAVLATPFLDIGSLVATSGSEQGLLGVAFHPNYVSNGYLFVNYTRLGDGASVIARYQRSATDPDAADPASSQVLLTIAQPYSNHNGGQLRFGPDGHLYIGMGDGGSSNDPQNRAQNLGTLLGKMLRIDVNNPSPPYYSIPAGNPFQNEIWAYGLRNPWRFSFDRLTGDLFIADVGQGSWEEINFQPAGTGAGANYGWRITEGLHCTGLGGPCPDANLTPPILEYGHALGCSVTGGTRYRGAASPSLAGYYLYGDYCSGRIWGATRNAGGTWDTTELMQTGFNVSTFGEDEAGEIYIAAYGPGTIYRISAP